MLSPHAEPASTALPQVYQTSGLCRREGSLSRLREQRAGGGILRSGQHSDPATASGPAVALVAGLPSPAPWPCQPAGPAVMPARCLSLIPFCLQNLHPLTLTSTKPSWPELVSLDSRLPQFACVLVGHSWVPGETTASSSDSSGTRPGVRMMVHSHFCFLREAQWWLEQTWALSTRSGRQLR